MPKRILTGKVLSNKADKTITVLVERRIMHPIYKKFVTKSKKVQLMIKKINFNLEILLKLLKQNLFQKQKNLK